MRRRLGLSLMVPALLLMSLAAAQAEVITFDHNGNQAGFELIQQSAQGVELKFRLEQIRLEEMTVDGTVYQQVSIPGIFLPVQAGAPNLPSLGRTVALPGGGIAHLTVIGTKREIIRGIDVLPAPPIPRVTDEFLPVYVPNPEIYGRDAFWPEQMVQMSERKQMRGVNAVALGISPFQYNPVRKELVVFSEIHVRIEFEGGNGKFGQDRLRSRGWDSILEQHLLNFDTLPALESVETDSITPEGEYQYVIITPDDPVFIEQAERLQQFRIEQGISTGVVTLTETGSTAAEIENWLDHAYLYWQTPPEAVLLLADWVEDGGTDGITCAEYNDTCISDNLYADYDGDHLPDIVFARITATPDSVERMVDKAIDYESNPPVNPSFYDEPLLAAGWQLDRWFVLASEINYGYWASKLGKHPVREYVDGEEGMSTWSTWQDTDWLMDYFGPNGLGYVPETPAYLTEWDGDAAGINEAINSGAFISIHRDHGGVFGWVRPRYVLGDLVGLYNEDLTYVFSINCSSGMFNAAGDSFAEAIHRMEHGAVGVIAASDVGYSFVSDILDFGMLDYIWPEFDPGYGVSGPIDPRPAFALASAKFYLEDCDGVTMNDVEYYKDLTNHLFHAHGDAYTTLYTEMPQGLVVESDELLPVGAEVFNVRADAGAMVALSMDGRILGVAEATGDWQEIPILPALESGEARLTVTKPNHYRYSAPIPVIYECTFSIVPVSVPILQQTAVQVTVWDDGGQLAPDMIVSIDGWGIDEISGVTDGSGEVDLSVLAPYGEDLIVRGREADKTYYCFSDDLPVVGGSDFGSIGITAAVPEVGLEGMLATHFEGVLTGSTSETDFTLYARGCGVDASVDSGTGSTAELYVTPTAVGWVEALIGKPGFNLYEQLVAVEWVFGTMSGTVRNTASEPLEGALVQIYAEGEIPGQDSPFVQTITDANGWYAFGPSLPGGPWDAYLSIAFGYDDLLQGIVVNAGANVIDFTMQYSPDGLLSGTVTDSISGDPLDAWIEIYRNDDQSLYAEMTTDPATGHYEVELPYFEYRIVAESFHHFLDELVVTIDQPAEPLDIPLTDAPAVILIVDGFSSFPSSSASAVQIESDLWTSGYKPELENYTETDPGTWWNYEAVVWSTCSAPVPLTDAEDRLALRDYIVGGGRLLLESANVAYTAMLNQREEWFFSDVLHGDYLASSVGYLELSAGSHVLANSPNTLGDIMPFELGIDDDVVDPRPDAELVYGWSDYPAGSGVLVWDDDPDPDHGNLVYMSFDYRDIDPVERVRLLENTFHYLINQDVVVELGTVSGTALLDGESDHSGISIGTVPASSTALTAGDGSYALTNVLAGSYSVVATKDGWTDGQVDGVEVVADQTTSGIDFLLYAEISNLPPVAENQQVNTAMNRSVDITLEASDPDGDPLTYICVDPPSNGTLDGCDDGDPYVTYTPDNQFTGNDSFTFKANDGELDSNEATVTVRVSKGGGGGGGGKPTDGVATLQLNPRDDD